MVQISCRRIAATWLSIIAVLHACRGQDIDVSGCGETKGCFQTPEGCDAASCEFLLTWTAAGDDSVFFEMSAPVDSQNSYVAFGLSQDALMVTFLFLCIWVFLKKYIRYITLYKPFYSGLRQNNFKDHGEKTMSGYNCRHNFRQNTNDIYLNECVFKTFHQ